MDLKAFLYAIHFELVPAEKSKEYGDTLYRLKDLTGANYDNIERLRFAADENLVAEVVDSLYPFIWDHIEKAYMTALMGRNISPVGMTIFQMEEKVNELGIPLPSIEEFKRAANNPETIKSHIPTP